MMNPHRPTDTSDNESHRAVTRPMHFVTPGRSRSSTSPKTTMMMFPLQSLPRPGLAGATSKRQPLLFQVSPFVKSGVQGGSGRTRRGHI